MKTDHLLLKVIALAGMYFFAAWSVSILGLTEGFTSPIYPATGVALGGFICWGPRVWPGVFIGAFAFNAWFMNHASPTPDSWVVGVMLNGPGMAVVAVAQGLLGTFLFNRFISSSNPLNRTKDVLIFIFVVAGVGSSVCSFICMSLLGWGSHLPWDKFIQAGITRWLGDVMGVLLVTPLFFVFRQPLNIKWTPSRRIEIGILLLLFYVTSKVVFGDWLQYSHYPLVYLLAPCLVWAAYRFGHRGTVIAILMVSSIAIWGTMAGRGPFPLASLEESFALLQSYLLVLTIMTLILCAAATEAENAQMQSIRFGRVLDESSNEIYLFDAQTYRFIQVNRGAQENLGYTLEELQSLTPLDLKPDNSQEHLESALESLRNGTENLVTFRTQHQRKNGTFYPVECRIQLSHTELYPVFVGIVEDITERRQAEQALRESEERLRLVLEATSDGIWDWNISTGEVFFSPQWFRSLGYEVGELKPHISSWEELVHPSDMPKLREVLNAHLEGKTSFYQFENRLRTKSGIYRWNLDRGCVVSRDKNGKPLRMVGADVDITERKQAEEELAVHRHHLEELVMQRTADLESTHLQLLHAEKLSATGKIAASMAHEFNNPIYGIRNVLEKIIRRVPMEGNNKRFVQLAIQECDRVTMLIRRLLNFHSPSTDEKDWVDVHGSIDEMLLLLQKKFSMRGINLVKMYASDIPKIEVVPDQFKQVILNILQNAEEAISEDGGCVTITTSTNSGTMQIKIDDTGVGIPSHVMKNIFDPFFTTKPSVKGTGLGLSVTYGIIKKHRGEILVDSRPGRTTFKILLPVNQEKPAASPNQN